MQINLKPTYCGNGGPSEEYTRPEAPFYMAASGYDVIWSHVILRVIMEHIPNYRVHSINSELAQFIANYSNLVIIILISI